MAGMYHKLYPEQSSLAGGARNSNEASGVSVKQLLNRFEHLELEDPDDKTPSSEPLPSDEDSDGTGDTKLQASAIRVPRIADDLLGNSLELLQCLEVSTPRYFFAEKLTRTLLQEIEDLARAVTEVWEQLVDGTIPLVMAGFMTNVAMGALKPVEQRLQDICDDPNPGFLSKEFVRMQEAGCYSRVSQDHTDSGKPLVIDLLETSWAVLKECRSRSVSIREQGTPLRENPTEFFARKGQAARQSDREGMSRIARNIVGFNLDQAKFSGFRSLAPSIGTEIHDFCLRKQTINNGLRLSFGLLLMYEAYRSFFSNLPTITRTGVPNCRLGTLRFVQEVVPWITEVLKDPSMPCRCKTTIALHLEEFQNELNKFIRDISFSLYSQCPWICSTQMVNTLQVVSYYSLKLLTYRQYVGAVMHCYNILCQYTGFQAIPILEAIIHLYEKNFFPGGRPDRNFRNCGTIYCGGRLKFDHNSKHENGCHNVIIPSKCKAKDGSGLIVEANDKRLDLWLCSWFFGAVGRGYNIAEINWEDFDKLAKNMITTFQEDDMEKVLTKDHPLYKAVKRYEKYIDAPSHRLQRFMLLLLNSDFRPEFPDAKINYLKLYLACVKVINIVSDRIHPDETGLICPCFFEDLTAAADTYNEYDGKRPFGKRDLVQALTDALVEVFGPAKWASRAWFWQYV